MPDIDDIWDDEEDRQQYGAPSQDKAMDANPMPLKDCPFCGSSEIDPQGWASSDGRHGPACDGCGASAESAEAWNRRQPPAVAVPEGWRVIAPENHYRVTITTSLEDTATGRGTTFEEAARAALRSGEGR